MRTDPLSPPARLLSESIDGVSLCVLDTLVNQPLTGFEPIVFVCHALMPYGRMAGWG